MKSNRTKDFHSISLGSNKADAVSLTKFYIFIKLTHTIIEKN